MHKTVSEADQSPTLKAPTFEKIRRLAYEKFGLNLTESKQQLVAARLGKKLRELKLPSYEAYYDLVQADRSGESLIALIDALSTNHTSFLREASHFDFLARNVLPNLRKRATIDIWSAPCSTGEEPYSIGLWLMENWPQVDNYNIEIVGSDIDTRALKAAAEGIYGDRALMRLSRDIVTRYFKPLSDGNHQIDEGLRGSIEFTRANLIDAQDMGRYRDFDLIFCRNVLIYFDDASRRQAAENLYDCLLPGGYICLGHSESMSRISPLFSVCRFPDAIVYQRPEADHG